MPLLYQQYVFRSDLQANPNVTYVFGDNLQRWGGKGQAQQMRGEPNAIGVITKWKPTMEDDAFFSDDQMDRALAAMKHDLSFVYEKLLKKEIVIWPLEGIGGGLSQLPIRAPDIWAQLEATRKHFETL